MDTQKKHATIKKRDTDYHNPISNYVNILHFGGDCRDFYLFLENTLLY